MVIFYKNMKNQKTYSCYEKAFVSRFFEFGNLDMRGCNHVSTN